MKNQVQYIAAIMLVAFLSLTSCKKDFEKINDDPNHPKEVPTSYLLTGAQKGLMDNNWDHWWDGSIGNQLAQFWASNQYTAESRYQFRTGITNSYWTLFYAGGNNDAMNAVGGLEELQTIIDKCNQDPKKYDPYGYIGNQKAVATILKVWQYQLLTDAFGDVPYSEALQGVKNPQPKFDRQKDIYKGLLNDLDSARAWMDVAQAGPQGDIIYSGDMSAWLKFLNSLQLRVAMRVADRAGDFGGTLIKDKVNQAYTSGVFTSNTDNALFRYLGPSPNFNLHYYDYAQQGRNDFAASNTMVDVLSTLTDPRVGQFYDTAEAGGGYVGKIYGLTEANAAVTDYPDVSQRSAKVLAADFPGIYLDYAEVSFFLAEAAERGFIAGSASSFYSDGIAASMEYWGVSSADATAYIAQPLVDYTTLKGGGKTWKEIIGAQKWIALYMQGIEAWSEWRRLDFGILQAPADGNLEGTGIPKRMKYPKDEQSVNGKHYNDAVGNQGADIQDTKVWWDVN